MSTPESKVKLAVKRWFDSRNAWSFAPVSNGMGAHGIPDRVGCVPVVITPDMVGQTVGLFVGVECKALGSSRGVTALQDDQLKSISKAGGVACVVDDATLLPAGFGNLSYYRFGSYLDLRNKK
jgi:hypothetical protein